MKIAISQLNYKVADPVYNMQKIIGQIERARIEGADVIVFAEGALTGTPLYDAASDDEFISRTGGALEMVAAASEGITVVMGLCTSVYNSAVVIRDGEIVERIDKENLTSRYEYSYFASGSGVHAFKLKGKKVAVAIGDDLSEVGKADIVINLAAEAYSHGIIAERYERLAAEGVPIIFVNHVGASTDMVYYGGSAYIGKNGNRVVQLALFDEDFAIVSTKNENETEFKTGDKIENVYKTLVLALRDYCGKRGFSKVCLGLSGGLDSAVVAALAADALGSENVHVLLMPSQYSTDHSVTDAVSLADKLGIRYDTVEIESIYGSFEQALSSLFAGLAPNVAEENLQSRIRGTLLMALSNKLGSILLNTTNKSEAAMGYGTLYGDTNGSLSLLGDLYKTEVYELARYINRGGEIIPQNTIDKAPSAELRHDQKDSDSLPEYDILDAILYRAIESGQSAADIIAEGYDSEIVAKVFRLLHIAEYKRYQLCPVVRLSHCVLGVDRVYPF